MRELGSLSSVFVQTAVLVCRRLFVVLDGCDNGLSVTVKQNGESTAVSATAVEVVLPLVVNAYLLTFRSHLVDDVAKVLLTSSPTGSVRRLCLSLCQREFRLRLQSLIENRFL